MSATIINSENNFKCWLYLYVNHEDKTESIEIANLTGYWARQDGYESRRSSKKI